MLFRGCFIVILFLCEHSLQSPLLKPPKLDTKSVDVGPALLPQPLVFATPEEKEDISGFMSIWEQRFSSQSDVSYSANNEGAEGAPKTILAVNNLKMRNLIPQDAPHPLYSSSYEKLTDDFILDSLSTETIDFNDPKLTSPQGVTIKTMSGKDLLFTKDPNTKKYRVNEVEIEKYNTVTGDTNIIILSDFLFNHHTDIRAAFDELVKVPEPETRHGTHEDGHGSPGFRAEHLGVVPQIPGSLKDPNSGAIPSGFIRIWENRLSTLDHSGTPDLRSQEVPKSVLAVTSSKMVNLIPQDAPHPLYSTSYEKLTDDFILDSLSTETIDFNDPQLTSPQGVTIKTMSGKDLLFRKDQRKNTFTVNAIGIDDHHELPDGTVVIILDNFLFNNYDKVQKAFHELSQEAGTPFLGPSNIRDRKSIPPPPDVKSKNTPLTASPVGVPAIPESFSTSYEGDKFLNIWEFRSSKHQDRSLPVPETILPVTFFRMVNLIPADAPHPLYSTEYQTLADNFILDSLSSQKINFEDPNLTSPEGVTIKSLTGKDLVFKKDASGKLTVNGIDIEEHKLLSDQKTVVTLGDFLFSYYDDIQKAFREMPKGRSPFDGAKRSLQSEIKTKSETESGKKPESRTINIPQVPKVLESDKAAASDLVSIWENRLSSLEKKPIPARAETREPKTVLAIETIKMINLVPQDSVHPLYSPDYQELTDNFILDSLSADEINFEDPELSTPQGVTITTMSGKDLTFKKDENTGKIQVNGVDVSSHKILEGTTNLVVLSDFLFNTYDEVQTAFNELSKKDPGSSFHGQSVIPPVPTVLETRQNDIDISGLLNIWEHRLSKFGSTSTGDTTENVPKIIVAVSPFKMLNLIPQDAPHPLYSDEYEHLSNQFILDSLSSETIDINDPNLSNSGVTIKTLAGKDLLFKKDESTNKFTINGINVENSKTFEDGTTVFIIGDYLFNLYDEVQSAFQTLLRESPPLEQPPF